MNQSIPFIFLAIAALALAATSKEAPKFETASPKVLKNLKERGVCATPDNIRTTTANLVLDPSNPEQALRIINSAGGTLNFGVEPGKVESAKATLRGLGLNDDQIERASGTSGFGLLGFKSRPDQLSPEAAGANLATWTQGSKQ